MLIILREWNLFSINKISLLLEVQSSDKAETKNLMYMDP